MVQLSAAAGGSAVPLATPAPLIFCVPPRPFPERAIVTGEQVLHTYGDLSDAQLLQTYGFVEEWPQARAVRGGGSSRGSSTQQQGQRRLENPNNAAFVPADAVADACAAVAMAAGCDDAASPSAHTERRQLLRRLGLLQNVVIVPAEQPLSEELLTAAQASGPM